MGCTVFIKLAYSFLVNFNWFNIFQGKYTLSETVSQNGRFKCAITSVPVIQQTYENYLLSYQCLTFLEWASAVFSVVIFLNSAYYKPFNM